MIYIKKIYGINDSKPDEEAGFTELLWTRRRDASIIDQKLTIYFNN